MDDDESIVPEMLEAPEAPRRRRPKKIVIPRRVPTIVLAAPQTLHMHDADNETVSEGFPIDVYEVPKRLGACQKTPVSLHDLAAEVLDSLPVPIAFSWSKEEVADWMADVVGLPEYRECILKNNINGMRLIMFEEPSRLRQINVRNFDHILRITENIRNLFALEFILFTRSIGLPHRKPLTHYTWFKSRTGPSWGIRKNWTRRDLLRWMKIIMPAPIYRDHWDLVWYRKPEFPKVMFARISKPALETIPRYKPLEREICREYQVPRRFRLQTGIPEEAQLIWMERAPKTPEPINVEVDKKSKKGTIMIPKDSRLYPKRVSLTGLKGKDLVLARRKRSKGKFLSF